MQWTPFDPAWYQQAFDRYTSTAEELFNTDLILQSGYQIPDSDKSRSSVFRNSAVTNNSFDEQKLRETLLDIYLNNSNRLKAYNHDNTHFYQWHGNMRDMKISRNTSTATFVIPIDTFIPQKDRDIYKLSQFYRKWISVQDILNNSKVFHWHCLLFINRRIYSEYELRIDDQEVTIRFQYQQYWKDRDYSIDIYKFDTSAQCRIMITREQCENVWNWKMPISEIINPQILNHDRVVVAFNRISDPSIRQSDNRGVTVLGDNLEFLRIEDGFIDLSNISDFNHAYIKSELKEWIWMSIFVPKFLHEYPILLPTDVVYRPYNPKFRKVKIAEGDFIQNVHESGDLKNLYVDVYGGPDDGRDGWAQMIRPIVLQDAYNGEFDDPYINFLDMLNNLRKLTVTGADRIEEFRYVILNILEPSEFIRQLDRLQDVINQIHEAHNGFLDKLLIEYDDTFESYYNDFLNMINDLKSEGQSSSKLSSKSKNNLWNMLSPIIYISRALVDRYNIIEVMNAVQHHTSEWERKEDYLEKIRFQRPIDTSDFWIFEYDPSSHVWRPAMMDVEYHYPDVYLIKNNRSSSSIPNRVFKAFFFYSDTANPRELASDTVRATPSWDTDIQNYHIDPMGSYHDIFMEKFYWMGIRAIYQGLLITQSRWELLEYVIDNDSYERFNELFMKSSDPYFKMSLSSYLKSQHFGFHFDEDVSKMQEALSKEMLNHKMMSNFEIYLEKTWAPSYFDTIMKIQDIDMSNPSNQTELIRRPASTFDFDRIIPTFTEIQVKVANTVKYVQEQLDWIQDKLQHEDYNLNLDTFENLQSLINILMNMIDNILDFTINLDPDIYSIDDLQNIINGITMYLDTITSLYGALNSEYNDARNKNQYQEKQNHIDVAKQVSENLQPYIDKILSIIMQFDMDHFLTASNDLDTYIDYRKENPEDNSLLGWINRFNDPWSDRVKACRDAFFKSSITLYGYFDPIKAYDGVAIDDLLNTIKTSRNDLKNLTKAINDFYSARNIVDPDQTIIDRLDYTNELLTKLNDQIMEYMDARNALIEQLNIIRSEVDQVSSISPNETEHQFRSDTNQSLDDILTAVSYIAGNGDSTKAYTAYENLKELISQWIDFLETEEAVFKKIFELTTPPQAFMNELESKRSLLEAIIEFIKAAGLEIGNDTDVPSYASVYSISEIKMLNGGFTNASGDHAFFPQLGAYQVVNVDEKIGTAIMLEKLPYRTTTFRDPMWQTVPYYSTTNGNGLGIVIEPTITEEIPIINDTVTNILIKKAKNIWKITDQNISSPNPYENTNLESVSKQMEEWIDEWKTLRSLLAVHISNDMICQMEVLTDEFVSIQKEIINYTAARSCIRLAEILVAMDQYLSENKINDPEVKKTYTALLNFYGSGSKWNDIDEAGALITEAEAALQYYCRFHTEVEYPSRVYELMKDTMDGIDNYRDFYGDILWKVDHVKGLLDGDIQIQQDKWYRFDAVIVGKAGVGYRPGDIVKIIPRKQTNEVGDEIDDQWDEIQQDVILLQVNTVNHGGVVTLSPFMDYAIPYSINGIRDTEAMVGIGSGLVVDIRTHLITATDNTILSGNNIVPEVQYGENDLIAFKFPNIHDLSIAYEVFIGGKQITDFVQRHERADVQGHPENIDVIYVKAKSLEELKNVSVDFAAEDYVMYKVDNLKIIEPGAGYYAGQEVFVDTGVLALRLTVAELVYGPTKGIKELKVSGNNVSKDENPSATGCEITDDEMNNIDDEFHISRYDRLTSEGEDVPLTRSLPASEYKFHRSRFDDKADGDRHREFMYGNIDLKDGQISGDPDDGYYQGSRIDNSQVPMMDERVWNGIEPLIPHIHPFSPDALRLPPNIPPRTEFQRIINMHIHNDSPDILYDLRVERRGDLPKNTNDYPDGKVGSIIVVEHDENYGGHRMKYQIRTFVINGNFVYDEPEYADISWNTISVDWMACDWYPDIPDQKAVYPTAPYETAKTYKQIRQEIMDGKHQPTNAPIKLNGSTYVKDLTVDDLSLFNWTLMKWEDLHDSSMWRLDVTDDYDKEEWGFTLTCLRDGEYSYNVSLFLNKTGEVLSRLIPLRKNAVIDVDARIYKEVHNAAKSFKVNTSNTIRIRRLFPYEQKESYTCSKDKYEMIFTLANYLHFRNEIHMEDIRIYNKTAGRFEDIMDRSMFELCIYDPKATARGTELQTRINRSSILDAGHSFVTGNVWAYNSDYDIHVFGYVNASFPGDGHMITFTPLYTHNIPTENISLRMNVYQGSNGRGTVVVDFVTDTVPVYGDGYIHNVQDPYAPIKKKFKVIVQYDLKDDTEYDIIINKNPTTWSYFSEENQQNPVIQINDDPVPADRMYAINNSGRVPLVNPTTGEPTIQPVYTDNGMIIQLNQMYSRYDRLEIRSVPYPMRSVYVQRRIPSHGFIDLGGKINKPLNKKYFEFWVNGKLLYDEVTIISPTKLILHGLTSLRNFEIIEINRDPNEYFSDIFLKTEYGSDGVPYPRWDFYTYLDAALEGNLKDNYTIEEQEYLLTPVWTQVGEDHPEYKNYPPNVDRDPDVLLGIKKGESLGNIMNPSFQTFILDPPTIEGIPITGRNVSFSSFGFRPITDEDLVNIMNEEWKDEIRDDPYFPSHTMISDDIWYGTAVLMYDEFGITVHNLNDAAYVVSDPNYFMINDKFRSAKIIKGTDEYDLS